MGTSGPGAWARSLLLALLLLLLTTLALPLLAEATTPASASPKATA